MIDRAIGVEPNQAITRLTADRSKESASDDFAVALNCDRFYLRKIIRYAGGSKDGIDAAIRINKRDAVAVDAIVGRKNSAVKNLVIRWANRKTVPESESHANARIERAVTRSVCIQACKSLRRVWTEGME